MESWETRETLRESQPANFIRVSANFVLDPKFGEKTVVVNVIMDKRSRALLIFCPSFGVDLFSLLLIHCLLYEGVYIQGEDRFGEGGFCFFLT